MYIYRDWNYMKQYCTLVLKLVQNSSKSGEDMRNIMLSRIALPHSLSLLILLSTSLTSVNPTPESTCDCGASSASIGRWNFPEGFLFGAASSAYQVMDRSSSSTIFFSFFSFFIYLFIFIFCTV